MNEIMNAAKQMEWNKLIINNRGRGLTPDQDGCLDRALQHTGAAKISIWIPQRIPNHGEG